MPKTENGASRQRSLRVPIPIDDWLQKRAKSNPKNRYRQVATEMNGILKLAFETDPKTKKNA